MHTITAAVLKKIFNFIKSTKLAVALIALLVILFLVATFVPQGQDETFYLTHYPEFIGHLIIQTHYYNFYRSYFFLVPLCLFFINLSACTFSRIIKRFKQKAPPRFGPDLIHLSILIFITIGVFSLQEQGKEITVAVGEEAMLPHGYKLAIFADTKFVNNPDFAVPAFRFKLKKDKLLVAQGSLETNQPLKDFGFFIQKLQYSYEARVIVKQGDTDYYELKPGLGFVTADGNVIFTGIEKASHSSFQFEKEAEYAYSLVALFTTKQKNGEETMLTCKKNDRLGPFVLHDIFYSYSVRFLLRKDTVSLFIIIAGGIFSGGLILTFYQKKGDKRL